MDSESYDCTQIPSCPVCSNLDFDDLVPVCWDYHNPIGPSRRISYMKLRDTAQSCEFCEILLDGFKAVSKTTQSSRLRDTRLEAQSFHINLWGSITFTATGTTFETGYSRLPKVEFSGTAKSSAIVYRPPVATFFSNEMFPLLNLWLQPIKACSSDLPTRLIDVGHSGYDSVECVAVVDSAKLGTNTRYITLSHCWVGRPMLTSDAATIRTRMQGIEFSELPPVFADTVRVCRFLGIRYLWVDALCIVQGDPLEWRTELSRMDSIFENSWLTIAVQEDDANGFLPRPKSHVIGDDYEFNGMQRRIKVREIREPEFLNPKAVFLEDKNDTNPGLVHYRGWCYQERYLSRQILHFTADEVFHEFNGNIQCQCGYHCRISKPHGNVMSQWRVIVKDYTQRAMTWKSDILPGITGIANRLSHRHSTALGNFVFGLWSVDFVRWMCRMSTPQYTLQAMRGACENYRPWPQRPTAVSQSNGPIPSFSWASRFGPCKYPAYLWNGTYTQRTHLVDTLCRLGEDGTPQSIVLHGPCQSVFLYSTQAQTKTKKIHCLREYVVICDELLHAKVVNRDNYYHVLYDDKKRIQNEDKKKYGPVLRKGACSIMHDAANDIPQNGTEVMIVNMFENYVNERGDTTFDDMPGLSMPDIVSVMPDPIGTLVALVLVKLHPTAGIQSGIAFIDGGFDFDSLETFILV